MSSVTCCSSTKSRIRSCFAGAAGSYDTYASHHRMIAQRLLDFLPSGHRSDSVLELGCGTGILTSRIAALLKNSLITAMDISSEMVSICRDKVGSDRVTLITGDAEEYLPAVSKCDLVVSSCSLQWMEDRDGIARGIHSILRRGGRCLLAIPVEGMLCELFESFRCGAGKEIRGLELEPGGKWARRFSEAGFVIEISRVEEVVTFYDAPLEVMKAVRGIGAIIDQGGSPPDHRDLRRMFRHYRDCYGEGCSGRVPSTYRVLYLMGRRD